MPWPRRCDRVARKRRHLTPEEAELWGRIKRTAVPLRPEKPDRARPAAAEPAPPDPPAPPASKPVPDLSDIGIGTRSRGPTPRASRPAPPVRMDAKAYGRMRRGKLPVDARIDLHGVTLAEAHPRLVSFVLSSHAAGRRLILVITGKGGHEGTDGDPVAPGRGVLRRQVPHWLSSAPLRGVVLQVDAAHRRHGGLGAIYVYLRRK